jgi:HD-GYP domain-containing protein (c-di-GMP phosphodiesterase class II)
MFTINIYAVPNFICAIISLAVGVFVFTNNIKSPANKSFLYLALVITLWQLGTSLVLMSQNSETAYLCSKLVYLGAMFIPSLTYYFVIVFLNNLSQKKFVLLSYLIGAILLFWLLMTNHLLEGVNKFYWGYWFKAGPYHPVYLIYFAVISLATFYNLLYSLKNETNYIVKLRKYYLITALAIAYLGAVDFFANYGFSFYPFGYFPIFMFIFITAIAMLRYRLLDIEVVIRETAIFAGIFGFSIGLFIIAISAGEQVLQPYIGESRWIIPALSLLFVTFAIRPIEKLVYSLIGRYLFKKKFEYQKTLQYAAEGMSKVRDPKKLLTLIVHIISAKMKLERVTVLLFDKGQQRYKINAFRGDIRDKFVNLRPENPLIQWLSEKKKSVTLEEIQKWTSSVSGKNSPEMLKSDLVQIENSMKNLGASVIVPCFFRDELLGLLALGEKKTGDFFTKDDLDLFSALSDEAAIAFKNSQLYFEIDRKASELEALYKREHKLFMHASVAFAAAIDARDSYTHGHSQRVTNISLTILDYTGAIEEIDRDPFFRQRLQITGVLHDIGKIGVPDNILHKPSKLTLKERKQIERHPVVGADIVSHIKGLRDLIGGIRYHHERYDGKGYPDGLKSEQIPLMARIISVADTYDAMTSDRPYRKGLSVLTAKEEIQRNASAQFDPYIVAAFLKAFEQGKIK